MSRFFEALQKAGGTRNPEAGADWENWGVEGPAPAVPSAPQSPVGLTDGPDEAKTEAESAAAARDALLDVLSAIPPVQGAQPTAEPEPFPIPAAGAVDEPRGWGAAAQAAAVALAPERTVPTGERGGKLVSIQLDPRLRVLPNFAAPAFVEYYRRLRTKLIQQHKAQPYTTLLITSPGIGEGKTLTTLNLAFSFSSLPSFRVLVIDGDLRRGTIRRYLGAPEHAGFGNVIDGTASIDDVVLESPALPFHFVLTGTSKVPAGELLQSSELKVCLNKLASRYSLVIIDSPPANVIADAHLLAANSNAVLLVTRAFATTTNAVHKAMQDLQTSRMLGAVLNGGAPGRSYSDYRGDY